LPAAGDTSDEARALAKACALNLSSCYLNTGLARECAAECTSVLEEEPLNRKALYRRGQARADLGELDGAAADLSGAIEVRARGQKGRSWSCLPCIIGKLGLTRAIEPRPASDACPIV
jgi:hypothetical protein